MINKVKETIEKYILLNSNDKVVVGVSRWTGFNVSVKYFNYTWL